MTALKVVKKENSMAGDIQLDETNVIDGGWFSIILVQNLSAVCNDRVEKYEKIIIEI